MVLAGAAAAASGVAVVVAPSKIAAVFLGGALGSVARNLVATRAVAAWGSGFPRGTLIVNAGGSFLLAAVMGLATETGAVSIGMRLFLATGIMGGFTTYSSFNYETLELFEEGLVARAVLNVGLTVVVCFVSGALGLALVRLAARAGA